MIDLRICASCSPRVSNQRYLPPRRPSQPALLRSNRTRSSRRGCRPWSLAVLQVGHCSNYRSSPPVPNNDICKINPWTVNTRKEIYTFSSSGSRGFCFWGCLTKSSWSLEESWGRETCGRVCEKAPRTPALMRRITTTDARNIILEALNWEYKSFNAFKGGWQEKGSWYRAPETLLDKPMIIRRWSHFWVRWGVRT